MINHFEDSSGIILAVKNSKQEAEHWVAEMLAEYFDGNPEMTISDITIQEVNSRWRVGLSWYKVQMELFDFHDEESC